MHDDPSTSGGVRVLAPAKVNLCLSVSAPLPAGSRTRQGRDATGFHEIASWFEPIALADELSIEARRAGEGSAYTIEWADDAPRVSPLDWPLEKDLAFRAHRIVEQAVGRSLDVRVRLLKRTPVGGGLGGGSSDAASMMLGLVRLFRLRLNAQALIDLSAPLGSDIAFFLDEQRVLAAVRDEPDPPPRGAVVTGLGDRIERLSRARSANRGDGEGGGLVLIVPPFGCPTGPVYKAFDAWLNAHPGAGLQAERVCGLAQRAGRDTEGGLDDSEWFNDLALPAAQVESRLGEVLERLEAARGRGGNLMPRIHVTGSGSTMFCVTDQARRVCDWVRGVAPELVCVPTRML